MKGYSLVSLLPVAFAAACLCACSRASFKTLPITLASGPVTVPSPAPITVAAPIGATITSASAVKLLNLQSRQLLNQLRSPAVNNVAETIQQTESQNEFYQASAIVMAIVVPFTASLHLAPRAAIAAIGGFVAYKSTKGSAMMQNKECQALNSEIAEVQQFDTKWTVKFTAAGMVPITEVNTMLDDAKTVSNNVNGVVNGCMNPYWYDPDKKRVTQTDSSDSGG